MASKVFTRLPRLCYPLRYVIEMKPCFESFTFIGKQSVTLNITEGTSEIIMNSRNLNVTTAKFNGSSVEVVSSPDVERITLKLNRPSLPGQAIVDLEFSGSITDKMEGFYRSCYNCGDEEKQYMLTTHFEPTGARQAFPCWDEPEFKSVFSIKLIVPKDKIAISNMPVASQVECDQDMVAYLFEDTPKMSSYLVAFAIGNFEYIEGSTCNGILVRVYSRKGYVSEKDQGRIALNTVCLSLPFFGDYFGTEYPLPKVDLLAVPDFAAGAMENWGLITFRERALLADANNASPMSKQGIAVTVSHELAHMWFGNLVTMKWWTDLWLKEGFATWIEYFCVDHCYPEIEIWTHFTYNELACALRLDALSTSYPIEVEVSSPSEIDEIFDTISYCKGASLIHMLHAYLGDDAFRSGLCDYLKKHAYANAVTEDLWSAWSQASGTDVGSLMRPWTQTTGFPVLSVLPIKIEGKNMKVKLSQQQYKLPSKSTSGSGEKKLWPIPITLTCFSTDGSHSQVFKHVLRTESEEVNIPLNWSVTDLNQMLVRANSDATGFYHTKYDESQLRKIANHIATTSCSPSSRFVFLNDGFALAKAGLINLSDWLLVLPRLMQNEDNYSIWRGLLSDGLSTYIRRLVHAGGVSLDAYKQFLLKLTRPALNKFGFVKGQDPSKPLSHNESLLRSLLITIAGAEAGDHEVINEAKRRFENHMSGDQKIPNDLRSAIYTTVVRHGSLDVVRYLMKAYETEKSPEERSHILGALGAASLSNSHEVGDLLSSPLHYVLEFCLNSNGPVRDQDRIHGLAACASWSNPSRLATWEAIKNDWPHITDIYGGQLLLASLIKSVLCGFCTEKEVSEIKEFFSSHTVSCPRAVSQVLETLEVNQILLNRDIPLISSALNQLK